MFIKQASQAVGADSLEGMPWLIYIPDTIAAAAVLLSAVT